MIVRICCPCRPSKKPAEVYPLCIGSQSKYDQIEVYPPEAYRGVEHVSASSNLAFCHTITYYRQGKYPEAARSFQTSILILSKANASLSHIIQQRHMLSVIFHINNKLLLSTLPSKRQAMDPKHPTRSQSATSKSSSATSKSCSTPLPLVVPVLSLLLPSSLAPSILMSSSRRADLVGVAVDGVAVDATQLSSTLPTPGMSFEP